MKCILFCSEAKTLYVNKGPTIYIYNISFKNVYFTWLFFLLEYEVYLLSTANMIEFVNKIDTLLVTE